MSEVVCVGWKSGKMCWGGSAKSKEKIRQCWERKNDGRRRRLQESLGSESGRVGVGRQSGGVCRPAHSVPAHGVPLTVCRTQCAAHTPVTLVECSPLMWQILCILRSVTTVNDFEVKSGMEHTHQHVRIALPHFEVTWGEKIDKLPMIYVANLDFTKAHKMTLVECSLWFWGDRSDAF